MNQFNADEFIENYYKSQIELCCKAELYSDQRKHGGKVLMLFAEVFSCLVECYGIESTTNHLLKYANSKVFKDWFWKVKHLLGECLKKDPSFDDIGAWIGKGFFLKMFLSFLIYSNLLIEPFVLNKVISRQKKLLENLMANIDITMLNNIIKFDLDNHKYFILNEPINLSLDNEFFFIHNIIK